MSEEQEQTSDPSLTSCYRVEVDSAAFARDRLTRELVLSVIRGRTINSLHMNEIVDNCREAARYIQETNEITDYWV